MTDHTADIVDFIAFKKAHIPLTAQGFCNNLTLLQSIMKLTNRIGEQYDQSIAVGKEIDEDAADVTEHIIGLIRDTYRISTLEIETHIQSTFNIRNNLPSYTTEYTGTLPV